MKIVLSVLLALLGLARAQAEVRVFIADTNGLAWVCYECTAGEVVRAFALDVSVDRGQITSLANFFRGPGTAVATGYGVFPASFRDHLASGATTNVDWSDPSYSPAANPADAPAGTLPGLGGSGITLEFGAVWDPGTPAAIPPSTGVLCSLGLSQPALVSISANPIRGGVSSVSTLPLNLSFQGGIIGPSVVSATVQNGITFVVFKGGELQTASSLNGTWTSTGNSSGSYQETFEPGNTRFFRVRTP